jgi:hypothetical protein
MVETRTRSGRQIKKPELYQPEETVLEDDYASDEYDSGFDSGLDTDDEIYSDEESDDDDEGSLKDFVVDDDEESEEEDT